MLVYPLIIVRDDRPDFVVVSLGNSISIEHTELIPENVAKPSLIRSMVSGPAAYHTPREIHGEKRKNH